MMRIKLWLLIAFIFSGCDIFNSPDETPPEVDFFYPENGDILWLRDTLKCTAEDDNKISWVKFVIKINENAAEKFKVTEDPYVLPLSLLENHLDSFQIHVEVSDGENLTSTFDDPVKVYVNNDIYPEDLHHDGDSEFLFDIKLQAGIIDTERTVWEFNNDLYRIKELHYWNLNLDTLPHSILNLTDLRELDINSNNLVTIPEFVTDLDNLIELRAAHNLITYLPENFGNLENLQILELNGNLLDSVPESFINLKDLKVLRMHNNSLDWLPDLSEFYDLNILFLAWNELTEITITCENQIFENIVTDPTSTNQDVTIDHNKICHNPYHCIEPILGYQDCSSDSTSL
tara:strand:- start:41 stop:1075 length:1035 start_codon:yes stop_codon:yes gene_type:complete